MGVVSQRKWLSAVVGSFSCTIALLAILYRLVWFSESKLTILEITEVVVLCTAVVLSIVVGVVCIDIYLLDPADVFSITTIRKMYWLYRKTLYYGPIYLKDFLNNCQKVDKHQAKVLLEVVKYNKNTLYGKEHKFNEINSVDDFRKQIKLSNYDTFKPYIDLICDGQKNVLTRDDPFCLGRTSGTTGNAKLIPVTLTNKASTDSMLHIVYYYPFLKGAKVKIKRTVILGHKPKLDKTKSGLIAAPLSYFYRINEPYVTSPFYTFDIPHENSSFYVHAIFACKEREVGNMVLLFSHQAYSFFTFLEENWQSICDDIESGTLTRSSLVLDDELYAKITNDLYPDRKRAMELRREFQKGAINLAQRLWPELQYCTVTVTGSMVSYGKVLQESYLKDVILLPNGYGGTEGLYGLNVSSIKDDPTYHLWYTYGLFEFIKEEDIEKDQPETLLAHEVKAGELYELVISNGRGLYRYRVGDVVKITGHTHQCPIMEYQYRSGQILNILGEKTTEITFYNALELARKRLGITIKDYTSCEDIHLQGIKTLDRYKRKYILFVEVDRVLSVVETEEFDKALGEESEIYKYMQTNRQSISPMEVIQVKPRTFLKLKELMIKETQNPQYKLPRALRVKEFLSFLLENSINM